jgi:hypothetical protein
VTHTKAAEYRRLAQECLAMALTLSTLDGRASLVAMAQVWQRLADEQEQGSEFGPIAPPTTADAQAVAQQQQQVQPDDEK